MPDKSEKIRLLEEIMEKASRDNPHTGNVLAAFKPLIVAKAFLMESLALDNGMSLNFDESLFAQGVCLLGQNDFAPTDDACGIIALSMLPAIMEGFPHLSADLEKIATALEKKRINLSDCLTSMHDEGGKLIGTWAQEEGVSGQSLGLTVRVTGRVYLERAARTWAGLISDFTWDKGYCPICGSPPMIARIEKGTGIRLLHCSQCGHAWPFSRVICPSCESGIQQNMAYVFVENKRSETAFMCEECRQYLITVDMVSDPDDFDAEVAALSLVHLDVILQQKGYRPMADCEWNACF
jgi:FdhE protein